ncbi:hypothetical protein BDV98DRAFT_562254 [Pterulicium gracile]|uniref:Succinate dehydrogenase assembly factor 4, mitochondrial n=1 Tax=Pterulicium gracile TaxID=1884261 RepID=A0A5C3QSC8_9AGAR|nr:hypothetical protein BDV98DRAFT_562254 [Pterula gracilis]
MLRHLRFRPSSLVRYKSTNLNRASPPPLPRHLQRQFEDLQRAAAAPLSVKSDDPDFDPNRHPDAPKPILAEFEGDINPVTGEEGGPKREPVRQWGGDSTGDWSQKGRVTDF